MEVKKRIVLWCGNAPNHKAFANKVQMQCGLAGIVIDKKRTKKDNRESKFLFKKKFQYLLFYRINNAWKKLQYYYNKKYSNWPDTPMLEVDNINNEQAREFTLRNKPDLIIVSGTGLIKETLLSIPLETGIMNLHTGLSPYVKGGPNCTNWCIANNEWGLIGSTIMWINAGIDTGNIITSEVVDIRKSPSLYQAHLKVMEHAHDLYLRAINYVINQKPPHISIPQKELGKGNLYLTKMWNANAKKNLLINWRKRNVAEVAVFPKTISLPDEFKMTVNG